MCVFRPASAPVTAHACLCLVTTGRRRPWGCLREGGRVGSRSAVCTWLALENAVSYLFIYFFLPPFCFVFFKPHACHLFLHVQIQGKEENRRHCDDEIAAWIETGLSLFSAFFYFLFFGLFSKISFSVLLQIKMDRTRRRWKRRLGARSPRPTFCLGILCQSANRWLSWCRWLPTVQVCAPEPHLWHHRLTVYLISDVSSERRGCLGIGRKVSSVCGWQTEVIFVNKTQTQASTDFQ